MAQLKFRSAPLYIDNKKIAEANNSVLDLASGDEVQIGADGVLGYSDGVLMGSLKFKTVTPVKGHEKDLEDAIYNKKTVTAVLPAGGKAHNLEGRMTGVTISSDTKAGTLTGDYTIEGKPSRT